MRTPRIDYWAGWLDGEGCFQYHKTTILSCNNTYRPNLERLRKRFGGAIHREKTPSVLSKKPLWKWVVTGENCRKACRELLPYLKEKQEQARILTRIMEYPRRSEMRRVLKIELGLLKRRAVA